MTDRTEIRIPYVSTKSEYVLKSNPVVIWLYDNRLDYFLRYSAKDEVDMEHHYNLRDTVAKDYIANVRMYYNTEEEKYICCFFAAGDTTNILFDSEEECKRVFTLLYNWRFL